ncbi:MAG TPA: glycosyltransferase family 1 protein [Candidatus Desulfofervidus auxilii]|uniref:Glycosyltransferase family 1 protein n=1 Tax=Desulfofervidus auxilii TaxID=1621989 RepID=A0A7C1VWC0_DESA2|nr:glycosyltransferase family 1 protein [Candidatus Desulfofervidus auxilii]
MKVAIVTLNNPFEKIKGGIESVVYNLSKALANLGSEIWVVCLGNVKNETIEKKEGVNLWILPDKKAKGLFKRSLVFVRYGKRAISKLQNNGIEIFNGQAGHSSPLAFYKPQKAKVVLTIHTMDGENIANIKDCIRLRKIKEAVSEIIKYPILKLWRIYYLLKSDFLIFVSNVGYNESKKYYWFLKKKPYIIPNGFPKIEDFGNLKKEKKYDFIYAGRIDKRKCVDLIIKASKILNIKGLNFSIIIVGNGGWRRDIEKLIEKHNLDNIKLIGYITHDKILEHISKSKFLILPSSYESDPLVIKESLSLGVPVISSDISAHTDKIKNEFNGLLFKNLDYKSLVSVMEKALNLNDEEYDKMSKNAKESIKNRSWVDVAGEYIKFFESLS